MKKNLLFYFVSSIALGIVLQSFLKFEAAILIFSIGLLLVVFVFLAFSKGGYGILLSLLAFLISLFTGALMLELSGYQKTKYPFQNEMLRDVIIKGNVTNIDLPRKNKITFNLNVNSISGFRIKNSPFVFNVNVYDSPPSLQFLYNNLTVGDSVEMLGTVMRAPRKENPGEFDYEKYLLQKGIAGLVKCYDAFDVNVYKRKNFSLKEFAFEIRKNIDEALNKIYNRDAYALLRGLLLADRGEIPNEIKLNFVNTGVIHVLAVSGLHVGYVLLIFLLLFNRFTIFYRYSFALAGLFLFALITGMPTSVVRATLMATFGIISFLSNRNYNVLNSVALAALVVLVFNPGEIFNPGFQLSFTAVLSIVFFAPVFKRKIYDLGINNKYIANILLFLSVTLSAQIGTLPFTMAYFGKLSLVSLVANLLVIPLIGFILGIGILSLLAFLFSIWLSKVFAVTNSFLIFILYKIVEFGGSQSFSYLNVKEFSFYDSLVYFVALFLIVALFKKVKPKFVAFLFSIIVFAVSYFLITAAQEENFPKGKLIVFAPETDDGNFYVVSFPDGKKWIFDFTPPNKNYFIFRKVQILNNLDLDCISKYFLFANAKEIINTLIAMKRKIEIEELLICKENVRLLNVRKVKDEFGIKNIGEITANRTLETGNGFSVIVYPLGSKGEAITLGENSKKGRITFCGNLTSSRLKKLEEKIPFSKKDLFLCGVKKLNANLLRSIQEAKAGRMIINELNNSSGKLIPIGKMSGSKITLTDFYGGAFLNFQE